MAVKRQNPPQNIIFIRDRAALDRFQADWDRLALQAQRFFPTYSEACFEIGDHHFLAAIDCVQGQTLGIACFLHRKSMYSFTIGERRLFSLPARETYLLGHSVVGTFGDEMLGECLRAAAAEWTFDVLTIGEVDKGGQLHRVSQRLGLDFARVRSARKDPIRWFIPLPPAFEDYLASLRRSTRKSAAYAMRRFARELDYTHEVVSRPDQIDAFLRAGESVSRKTYQWQVGQRLVNDADTQARYRRLARQGRLRCHLLRVNGEPCAFARGEIGGRTFNYETPGFDPSLQKYSPGLVLMMWTIRDLIEHTDCTLFDFGAGGDHFGYKARFGTLAVPCVALQFGRLTRPYSAVLVSAQAVLSWVKDLLSAVIGHGPLRQRLKRRIRVYEAGELEQGQNN